ncbi:hypothetical protein [Sphingomonas carotinifaciens]|uniref:hypothetical protein n=1 Tax=Sphingomonas carotinifaciens TaxID=1166323 RepID=UPI0012372798|nr:hypothetical protein [Sphingomonas carotinifaciens]
MTQEADTLKLLRDTLESARADPALFVDELQRLSTRRTVLIEALTAVERPDAAESLLHPDLSRIYREKVTKLTAAYEDEALRAQAFERIRALIEAVVLTPKSGDLTIELRGELALVLELSASTDMQNASEAVASEALQIKVVAGTGFEPVTFRL